VVPEKPVAAIGVAATYVAMALAVSRGRCVVTGRVVIPAIAVTAKYVVRAKNAVRIQVLIAALLVILAVKGTVVSLLLRPVVTASVALPMTAA